MCGEGEPLPMWDDAQLEETDWTARRVIGFLDLGPGEDAQWDEQRWEPALPIHTGPSPLTTLSLAIECSKIQRASQRRPSNASTEDRVTATTRSCTTSTTEERLSPGASPSLTAWAPPPGLAPPFPGEEEADGRTTLMVRNIPRKYTQRQFLNDLQALYRLPDAGCDFFYLPADLGSGRNLGYAFLNFLTPAEAARFKAHFHKLHLYPSAKSGLSVGYAVVQGLERNLANIRRSSVYRIKNPEFRPLVLHSGALVPVAIPR